MLLEGEACVQHALLLGGLSLRCYASACSGPALELFAAQVGQAVVKRFISELAALLHARERRSVVLSSGRRRR